MYSKRETASLTLQPFFLLPLAEKHIILEAYN